MESSKNFLLLFLSSLLLILISSTSAALIGGYQPINNVKDPYIVEIAKFAITQHNREKSDGLVFVKVLSGEQQVVAGINYKLTIKARIGRGNGGGSYLAEVYDKPWMKVRNLTSFQKAA